MLRLSATPGLGLSHSDQLALFIDRQERLLRPVPLPVHDWHMTGLDVNRGYTAADISATAFAGAAAAPAMPLT